MAAVLYCNGTFLCNFGEKVGLFSGKTQHPWVGLWHPQKKNLNAYCTHLFQASNQFILYVQSGSHVGLNSNDVVRIFLNGLSCR